MKIFRSLLLLPWIFFLFSCTPQRVLILSDPVFDHFASEQMHFYAINRTLLYLQKGFLPESIEINKKKNYSSIQELIDSGRFNALVLGYLDYYSLTIPPNVKTVLIGGSREIRYESSSQVVTSNVIAFSKLSRKLLFEWTVNNRLPVTVLWYNPMIGDDELDSLLSAWDSKDQHIITDNMLILRKSDKDVLSKLESFFRRYDFTSQAAVVTGACPPVLGDFLKTLPQGEKMELILSIPDNPVLPDSVIGIIAPSYKMIIKGSVNALNEYSSGTVTEIQNIFINK